MRLKFFLLVWHELWFEFSEWFIGLGFNISLGF